MNMRRKSFILAAVAAFAAVACGPKVSDKTSIEGTFEAGAPDSVTFVIPDLLVETTVPVTDGKFTAELPASKTAMARLTGVGSRVAFIPLTFSVKEDGTVEISSKDPSVSIQ